MTLLLWIGLGLAATSFGLLMWHLLFAERAP